MRAWLCFSEKGLALAKKLQRSFGGEIYHSSLQNRPVKDFVSSLWKTGNTLVFVGATGIAVRFIAPYVEGKDEDPAVLVIDDLGRYVISLLSGHLGGANDEAREIGRRIEALPIITTATDGRNLEGLDLFAKRMNFYIEDLHSLTPFTGKMVNGKEIPVYNPMNFPLPKYPGFHLVGRDYPLSHLAITEEVYSAPPGTAFLRPKVLHVGVGARKDVEETLFISFLEEVFRTNQWSLHSLKDIATIPLKAREKAIIKGAEYFNVPLLIYPIEELEEYDELFQGSEFVKKTVGLKSVSATCAHKSAPNVILEKETRDGITISVSKEVCVG